MCKGWNCEPSQLATQTGYPDLRYMFGYYHMDRLGLVNQFVETIFLLLLGMAVAFLITPGVKFSSGTRCATDCWRQLLSIL